MKNVKMCHSPICDFEAISWQMTTIMVKDSKLEQQTIDIASSSFTTACSLERGIGIEIVKLVSKGL